MPDTDQVQEALEGYYREKHPDKEHRISEVMHMHQGIAGNVMYSYRLETLGMGKTHQEELILRMSDYGQERSVRALRELQATTIPVPTIYDQGDDMLGTGFTIMEKVKGQSMPLAPVEAMTEVELVGMWEQFATVMADIHQLDWQEAGLEFLDPPKGRFGYADRMIFILRESYRASNVPGLDAVLDWMESNKPPSGDYVLLHGDYYPNNVIVHQGNIVAVVDWDGVGIGDVAFDVCEIPMFYKAADPSDQWSGPFVDRFLADYRERTGSDLANLDYYLVAKALLYMTVFLPGTGVDPNWRAAVLGSYSEAIWERTGIRILEGFGLYRKAQIEYSLILSGRGDWASRERLLKKAVEADPGLSEAYRALANSYMQRLGGSMSAKEAAPAAHAAIGKAMELDPESLGTLFQLGQIYLSLDLDYANAETVFRRVLDKVPSLGWCQFFLATIALREGRSHEAVDLLASAPGFNAGEEHAAYLRACARLLFAAGDCEQSLKTYAEGLNLMPTGED